MKKITLFLSAMLFSVMSFAGLGEGYSKVTDITTLSAGDKVVLYSDDAQLGVTGWNGNKDATVAESGWVEYVVEVADGGFYLKDGEQYITGAESANHFKYGEKAVCGVNKDGVLACGTKFLYKNGDYYRMYTDKSSNNAYKPFYVYKAGEGGGETPDTPDTPVDPEEPETPVDPENPGTPEEPETPVGSIDGYSKVTNAASLVAGDKVVLYCDDAQLGVTGWNGNKDATVAESGWVEYVVEVADGGFYLKDGEQYITGAESANHFKYGEKAVCGVDKDGVLACGTKFLYKNGDYYRMYTDKSSNNAYKPFYVYKAGEGGGETPEPENPENPNPEQPDPENPDTPTESITCAEALAICQATGETSTAETYTIHGYVTEIKDAYSEQYGNISYWMADAVDGGQVLLAFRVKPLNAGEENVKVGDFVEVVGTLVNYKGNTPEVNAGGKYTIITAGEGGDTPEQPETGIEIKNLKYADAVYVEDAEYGDYWEFDLYNGYDYDAEDYVYPELYVMVNEAYSKTAINGTYNVLYSEYLPTADDLIITDEYAEDFVGTLTIKNVDSNGNYSFKGSFTANDGKTYTFNQTVEVYAYSYAEEDGVPVYEEIILNEGSTTPENPDPENPDTPSGEVTFDADVDMGDASLDAANQTPYTVSKEGLTLSVSKGIIGVYNNENHYRVYKSETLTITSTVGNIVSVEFTCTANDDVKYGPGCFTVDGGSYTYSGAVGTWNGSATEIVFTATSNQVRATEIVVTVEEGTAVDNVFVGDTPVKVINNGQLFIIRGENTYNVLGAQVK